MLPNLLFTKLSDTLPVSYDFKMAITADILRNLNTVDEAIGACRIAADGEQSPAGTFNTLLGLSGDTPLEDVGEIPKLVYEAQLQAWRHGPESTSASLLL